MARIRNITTMAEMQASLQAAFNAINKDFYGGELEKVVITLKEGKQKHAFGWIEVRKNWTQNGKERHEINISVDYIGERSVQQVIATLMHEMAHLYNLQHDIKDTTRSGKYHNKKFKETAEKHGLTVKETEDNGYSYTELTEQSAEWIKNNINIKKFGIYKNVKDKGTNRAKSSYRKYICPICGLSARTTKDAVLICGEHKAEMKLVES